MSEIPSDLSENESVPPDVPEPLFTFDPHLLSEDAKRYLGDDLIPLYTRARDSILAHDGVVEDVASEADSLPRMARHPVRELRASGYDS